MLDRRRSIGRRGSSASFTEHCGSARIGRGRVSYFIGALIARKRDRHHQHACTQADQSRLSESLEKQPLLLGAIGLAVGAGIASTFATTAVESELMGEQGSVARQKLQGLSDDVTDRAKQIASALKEEAKRQGLTPDAAKNVAAGIGEKVKTIAGAGRDSVAQQFAPASN